MRSEVKRDLHPTGFVVLLVALAAPAIGQEFRALRPIPTPTASASGGAGSFVPIEPRKIEAVVHELFAAWNTPRMRQLLGPAFYDAAGLVDTLATETPRDAVLRVLAIEGISTLAQSRRPGPAGQPDVLVSTVSVIVRSQLEFNDPARGFQRREGVNEYVFEVKGSVPR